MVTQITFIYNNRFFDIVNSIPSLGTVPRDHLSRDLLAPYDNKPFIVRPCHPVVEESSALAKYNNSTTSRHRAMFSPSPSQAQSAQHLHEDIFTQHVYLRKSRGGQCWLQDIDCFHRIQGY
jgi:hypothetical protein